MPSINDIKAAQTLLAENEDLVRKLTEEEKAKLRTAAERRARVAAMREQVTKGLAERAAKLKADYLANLEKAIDAASEGLAHEQLSAEVGLGNTWTRVPKVLEQSLVDSHLNAMTGSYGMHKASISPGPTPSTTVPKPLGSTRKHK